MVEQILVLKEEAQFSAGSFQRMEWKDGRLALICEQGETVRGSYTSPEYRAVAFDELVVSWNAVEMCIRDSCCPSRHRNGSLSFYSAISGALW